MSEDSGAVELRSSASVEALRAVCAGNRRALSLKLGLHDHGPWVRVHMLFISEYGHTPKFMWVINDGEDLVFRAAMELPPDGAEVGREYPAMDSGKLLASIDGMKMDEDETIKKARAAVVAFVAALEAAP